MYLSAEIYQLLQGGTIYSEVQRHELTVYGAIEGLILRSEIVGIAYQTIYP